MKSVFPPVVALISSACLVFLSACGAKNQSVVTGDFSSVADDLDGTIMQISYLEDDSEFADRVVLASTKLDNSEVQLKFSFDDDTPRFGVLHLLSADDDPMWGRRILLESGAQYTMHTVPDSADFWFVLSSSGAYGQKIDLDVESAISVRRSWINLVALENQVVDDTPAAIAATPIETGPNDVDTREPSVHSKILDWEKLTCADYAGDYVSFWDRRRDRDFRDQETKSIELLNARKTHRELAESVYRKHDQYLAEMFESSTDPIERLLILENGVDLGLGFEYVLRSYEELETKVPEDVYEDRVTPRLPWLREVVAKEQADSALKLGTFAPGFELRLSDNQSVPLATVLQSNELVVVDFWENYCGSCIEAFRQYQEFYADYADLGFEVVTLSMEEEREEWSEKSRELELPWIDAIVPGGYKGDIAFKFGVEWARKNFVLDSEGCILKRDLTPNELLDFLEARLGS